MLTDCFFFLPLPSPFLVCCCFSKYNSEISHDMAVGSVRLWKYAKPLTPLTDRFLFDAQSGIGFCGDWCGGPRIEVNCLLLLECIRVCAPPPNTVASNLGIGQGKNNSLSAILSVLSLSLSLSAAHGHFMPSLWLTHTSIFISLFFGRPVVTSLSLLSPLLSPYQPLSLSLSLSISFVSALCSLSVFSSLTGLL